MSRSEWTTVRITRETHAALSAYASREGRQIGEVADEWLAAEIDQHAPGLRAAITEMVDSEEQKKAKLRDVSP